MSNLVPTQKDLNSSAIANTIQIKTVDDLQKLGEILSKSGFFDDCKQAAQADVKILAGSELGFPAFSSMVGIHIIKGKPALGANLIAAAVKRSTRYNYRVLELNDKVCKIAFLEVGKEIGISEFTAADATRAGTQNMNKFPRNMLFARAISNGVKFFCPDIFLGATVYTPDELGATVDDDGNVVELPDPIQECVSTRQAASTDEVWRQWKSPSDAINWAGHQLPSMSMNEIQAEFDALPTTDGKKAPAWVERVNQLVLEQF
jgi:hypothetical protein